MGRRYFPRCSFGLRADKVQRPIHRQTRFSLVDPQDAVDLRDEILFGNGETKKLEHPGIEVLLVPKHPFMDDGLPADLLISGQLHHSGEISFKVVSDMARSSMSPHKTVKETARGRVGGHLHH